MYSKASFFEFTSYKFEPDKKRIFFNYKTEFKGKDPLFFTETIILPSVPDIDHVPKALLNKLMEGLHIILGISYYKLYCATKVKLNYDLSKKEADFWNTVYKKGLGEFFYKNKLNPNISPKFPFVKNTKTSTYTLQRNDRCLVGIGGGKDSIVSAELLKEGKFDINAFYITTSSASELVEKIIETIGIKKLKIQRFLDQQLYKPHQYNGHIPISAIYAFLGLFASILYKYSYVIVSNEYSSNFGNLKYKGQMINHQWSKSFEFEKLFGDYVKNYISPDVVYFSLLRSFYEIRIVKMFSKLKKYFPYFSSCNRNFTVSKKTHSGLWCLQCHKCIFAFTLLSAFLHKKDLVGIFKKNLYQDKNLLLIFKDILGFGKMKPFDCVGTFEEAQTALSLAKKSFKNDFIMRQLVGRNKYHEDTFTTNKEINVPEQFVFLGMEKVLILGYGKEGRVTKKYLKKYYPKLKIGIADATQDKDYLGKQMDFDITIKTPGIKKELVTIPHTTATNIFFSKVLGKNLIIGVTGSKGKSTTASLVCHLLKTAGKNVELLGNIGKPMLEALLKPVPKNRIFVLEISSFQLDDLKFSPNIAVVTNLFPEHMDYHGNIKNYYEAKKNIINFQNKNNYFLAREGIENIHIFNTERATKICSAYFIYDPKNKIMSAWLQNYKGKAVPFSKNIPLESNEIPLIGEHNKNNIKAAISVAKIFGISDQIIKKAIKNFKGLPHRLEFVGKFKGINFYDDAISTTPESTIMAIKSLPNIDTIFLGGQDRGYNFSQLEKTIKKYKIRNIVLFPESGDKMLKLKKNFNILKTSNMEKAVRFAFKNTKKGSICLLSCASPSYSIWKNFEEKGDQFQLIVKKMAK